MKVATLCYVTIIYIMSVIYWSFVEKTSVKQSIKCKGCSNFQMSFLHLGQTDPPVEASQVSLTFGHPLGQADL